MTSLASAVIDSDLTERLIEAEREHLQTVALVAGAPPAVTGTLPYDSGKVFTYAQAHCAGGNDCPDGSFPLDCTHFLCHALNATGIVVANPSAQCRSRLCVRVNDLAAAFSNSVGKFANVKRIGSHAATRRGDFCFIPSWFGLSKEHGMLLASQATAAGATVYAHTNNRCGAFVSFEGADCVYYRIEDASAASRVSTAADYQDER